MKVDFNEFHHEKVKTIVKWLSDPLPSGKVTTYEAQMVSLLVHIYASMQTIEEYCFKSLEDRYVDKEKNN